MSGERLSPEAEQAPRFSSTEPRRLPVPLSHISTQILLQRPAPHLGLCGICGSSVSQWPQGHITGDFRFAVAGEWDQQNSCKAGSLRNGTELSLRLAGVCYHSIIILPISFHRWFGAAINGMCFLNRTIIICILFTSDKTPAETHKELQTICRECYQRPLLANEEK